ncbi:hypothetical protein NHQ30_005119 [Ciborinia camelliae]|nr:hypothetical protein NHQ30_005119 [Ciborinia camelliae]
MTVAATGNSLPWTPDTSLHAGVYKIYWVPSDDTESEVDSPTFTLGQIGKSDSQISSTSSGSGDGTSTPTTTNGGVISASSSMANDQPQPNQSNPLTNTIKISIAVSVVLGLTLIMLVAFIFIRRRRYLATMPKTKRQLATKEIADDNDSWYGEHQFKAELPALAESETAMGSCVNLVKKKHVSVNAEPVEMDAYFFMNDIKKVDDGKQTKEGTIGLGLGLGDLEELLEPRELDAGTIMDKSEIGHKFNVSVRNNVNHVEI